MGVAVITGAGSGMGRATAELYLDRDWQVIAVDIADNPGLESANLHWVKADVRNRENLEAALAPAVAAAGGQIDAVERSRCTQCDRRLCSVYEVGIRGS